MNYAYIILIFAMFIAVLMITINSFKEGRKAKAIISSATVALLAIALIVSIKNELGLMDGLESTRTPSNDLCAGIAMLVVMISQLFRTVSDFKKEEISAGRKFIDIISVVIAAVASVACFMRYFGILL